MDPPNGREPLSSICVYGFQGDSSPLGPSSSTESYQSSDLTFNCSFGNKSDSLKADGFVCFPNASFHLHSKQLHHCHPHSPDWRQQSQQHGAALLQQQLLPPWVLLGASLAGLSASGDMNSSPTATSNSVISSLEAAVEYAKLWRQWQPAAATSLQPAKQEQGQEHQQKFGSAALQFESFHPGVTSCKAKRSSSHRQQRSGWPSSAWLQHDNISSSSWQAPVTAFMLPPPAGPLPAQSFASMRVLACSLQQQQQQDMLAEIYWPTGSRSSSNHQLYFFKQPAAGAAGALSPALAAKQRAGSAETNNQAATDAQQLQQPQQLRTVVKRVRFDLGPDDHRSSNDEEQQAKRSKMFRQGRSSNNRHSGTHNNNVDKQQQEVHDAYASAKQTFVRRIGPRAQARKRMHKRTARRRKPQRAPAF